MMLADDSGAEVIEPEAEDEVVEGVSSSSQYGNSESSDCEEEGEMTAWEEDEEVAPEADKGAEGAALEVSGLSAEFRVRKIGSTRLVRQDNDATYPRIHRRLPLPRAMSISD